MKKIFITILLSIFCVAAFSQVRTATTQEFKNSGDTYIKYTGLTADTLTSNLDSIMFPVFLKGVDTPIKFSFNASFAKRSGNDTLIIVTAYGRNFDSESWTRLTSTHSANVTSSSITISADYGTLKQYRQIRLNFQIAGMKSTGVKLNYFELKLFKQ